MHFPSQSWVCCGLISQQWRYRIRVSMAGTSKWAQSELKQFVISSQVPYQRMLFLPTRHHMLLTHLRRKIKGSCHHTGQALEKVVKQNPIIKTNHLVHTPHFFLVGNKILFFIFSFYFYIFHQWSSFPAQVNNCAQIASIHR